MKTEAYFEFVKAALKNPLQISTIFQTGPWLRDQLLSGLDIKDADIVVELGPGAGAITEGLVRIMNKETKYFGIELNEDLVLALKKFYPELTFYQKSAEYCEQIAKENKPIDVIASSLPWTVFPYGLQERLVKAIHSSLKPGGQFATYMCVNATIYPAAESFKELIYSNFDKVEKSQVVWRNIPPAFVYTCTKK